MNDATPPIRVCTVCGEEHSGSCLPSEHACKAPPPVHPWTGSSALAVEISVLKSKLKATGQNLGNLLALIFGDGGHRQHEIGDDAKAVEEAVTRWTMLVQQAESISSNAFGDAIASGNRIAAGESLIEELRAALDSCVDIITTAIHSDATPLVAVNALDKYNAWKENRHDRETPGAGA